MSSVSKLIHIKYLEKGMFIVNIWKELRIKIMMMIQIFFLTILYLVTLLAVSVVRHVSALFHSFLSAKFWIVF